jgi:hypothetical protein
MKTKKKWHSFTIKTLGGVGYFTVFMEWFWLLALYLPGFFESEVGKTIFPQAEPKPVELKPVEATPLEPSLLMTVIVTVLALGVVALIIYVIFAKYIPGATRAATKVVHVATEKTVPVIAHKPLEKIPARKRKLLTARVQFWMKTIAAVLPLLVVFAARFGSGNVESQLVIFGLALLCAVSLTCFILQTWLAHRWRESFV